MKNHVFFVICILVYMLPGCASQVQKTWETNIQTWPSVEPTWILDPIEEKDGFLCVVGRSRPKNEKEKAKEEAILNAMDQVVKYIGMSVESFARSMEAESIRQDLNYYKADYRVQTQIRAKAFIRRATPTDWYIRRVARMQGEKRVSEFHDAFVRVKVPVEEIDRLQDERDIKLSLDIGFYHESKTGEFEEMTEGTILRSGDAYAIYIKPTDTCFLYVYQVDDLGHSFRLFPNQDYRTSRNPVMSGTDFWIPNTDQFLVLDETTGKERFYIFASSESVEDFEQTASLEKKELERTLNNPRL